MSIWIWLLLYFVIGLIGALGVFALDYRSVRDTYTPGEYVDSSLFEDHIGTSICVIIGWPIVFIFLGFVFGFKAAVKSVLSIVQSLGEKEEEND